MKFIATAILVMTVILTLLGTIQPAAAEEDNLYLTQEGALASPSIGWLNQCVKFIQAKDRGALVKMIQARRCLTLEGLVPVYLEERYQINNIVRIRPKGQTYSVYTVATALWR